jgi:hypothetical protein
VFESPALGAGGGEHGQVRIGAAPRVEEPIVLARGGRRIGGEGLGDTGSTAIRRIGELENWRIGEGNYPVRKPMLTSCG